MSASLEKITTENTEGTEKTVLEQHHLAEIQINGALDMFEQKNYICAIALANIANNFLKNLMKYQQKAFFDNYVTATNSLRYLFKKEIGDIKADALMILNEPHESTKYYLDDICSQSWGVRESAIIQICWAGYNLLLLTKQAPQRLASFIEKNSSVISVPSVVNDTAQAPKDINQISGEIIDCAIQVHKLLGPGLLESAYQQALAHVLAARNIPFSKEKPIPITLDGLNIEAGYRADFIIDDKIILEIKSVDKLAPIHEAQLLTYMKLGKFPLGILLNFNEKLLKDGIKRMRL